MPISVKICGIDKVGTLKAAAEYGVDYIGFVFFNKSPRNLTLEKARKLSSETPQNICKVALFVNPTNAEILNVTSSMKFDLIQLHGDESPSRVREIKEHIKLPVMKAIKLGDSEDLNCIDNYYGCVDRFLFDAKTPKNIKNALPGGNSVSFDWSLINHKDIKLPWMLAGGLNTENIEKAVSITGAQELDVSSGVESEIGVKDSARIKLLMEKVREISTNT